MKVCAKRRGLIREIRRGEKVEWLNFNRFGIAFSCLTRLDIQEKIILDIQGKEKETLTVKDLLEKFYSSQGEELSMDSLLLS